MNIKEILLDMPAKKLVLFGFVALLAVIWLVQSLFINQVLSVLSHGVTYFERMAKEDTNEMANDMRATDEQMQYDQMISDHHSAELSLSVLATAQQRGCYHANNIKLFEKMKTIAYVKHHPQTLTYISNEISESQEMVNQLIKSHQFDPTLCEKDTAK